MKQLLYKKLYAFFFSLIVALPTLATTECPGVSVEDVYYLAGKQCLVNYVAGLDYSGQNNSCRKMLARINDPDATMEKIRSDANELEIHLNQFGAWASRGYAVASQVSYNISLFHTNVTQVRTIQDYATRLANNINQNRAGRAALQFGNAFGQFAYRLFIVGYVWNLVEDIAGNCSTVRDNLNDAGFTSLISFVQNPLPSGILSSRSCRLATKMDIPTINAIANYDPGSIEEGLDHPLVCQFYTTLKMYNDVGNLGSRATDRISHSCVSNNKIEIMYMDEAMNIPRVELTIEHLTNGKYRLFIPSTAHSSNARVREATGLAAANARGYPLPIHMRRDLTADLESFDLIRNVEDDEVPEEALPVLNGSDRTTTHTYPPEIASIALRAHSVYSAVRSICNKESEFAAEIRQAINLKKKDDSKVASSLSKSSRAPASASEQPQKTKARKSKDTK